MQLTYCRHPYYSPRNPDDTKGKKLISVMKPDVF